MARQRFSVVSIVCDYIFDSRNETFETANNNCIQMEYRAASREKEQTICLQTIINHNELKSIFGNIRLK